MKKRTMLAVAVCFCAVTVAKAQDSSPAPKILQITREEVKAGKGAAHAKFEAGWPRVNAKYKWPTHYVALTTVAGPNEAWYITGFDSLAAWETDQQNSQKNAAMSAELDQLSAGDGEYISGLRTFVARYREDLSHRPGVNIGKMRYIQMTVVRVRPGHNDDYEEIRKMVKAAHEKAGVKDNHSVFQVVSGMPNGTYLVTTPMRSLADLDSPSQIHGQAYMDAIGDEGRKKMGGLASSGVISGDSMILAFAPGMSYPSKEYVAADPDFWAPKSAAKAAPAAKKEAAKEPAKK